MIILKNDSHITMNSCDDNTYSVLGEHFGCDYHATNYDIFLYFF